MSLVEGSPALALCMHKIAAEMSDRLAVTLAEEAGAPEGDELPQLIAWQIVWVHATVFREIGRRAMAQQPVDEIVAAVLRRLDLMEHLLSDTVLEYAVRTD
jgi:hypothetical protein